MTRRQIDDAGVGPTTVDRLVRPGADMERVAHGVYQLAGTPIPDHRDLRPASRVAAARSCHTCVEENADEGVVSHRSAAAVYGLGNLPADRHEFTVPKRRQTRRADVRIHIRPLSDGESVNMAGLPVTRPSRIASDLLRDHEDPEAVAQIVVESIREMKDYPGTFVDALGPHATHFGLRNGDGMGVLRWLIGLVGGDADSDRWIAEAHAQLDRAERQTKEISRTGT